MTRNILALTIFSVAIIGASSVASAGHGHNHGHRGHNHGHSHSHRGHNHGFQNYGYRNYGYNNYNRGYRNYGGYYNRGSNVQIYRHGNHTHGSVRIGGFRFGW